MKFTIDLQIPKPEVLALNGGACTLEGQDQSIVLICDGVGSWVHDGQAPAWVFQQLRDLNLCTRTQGVEDCARYIQQFSKEASDRFPLTNDDKLSFSVCYLLLSASGTVSLIHASSYELALIRNGQLIQKSHIHRWVDTQIELGNLSHEQAKTHPFRNIFVGPTAGRSFHVSEHIGPWIVQPGDEMLLMDYSNMERVIEAYEQAITGNPSRRWHLKSFFTTAEKAADKILSRYSPFALFHVLE